MNINQIKHDLPCFVNHSSCDLRSLMVEGLDKEGNILGPAPGAFPYALRVISPRHGGKHLPVLGHSDAPRSRITAEFANGDRINYEYGLGTGIGAGLRRGLLPLGGPSAERYRAFVRHTDSGQAVFSIHENIAAKNWMSGVSDSLLLSQFSIPGTHETFATVPIALAMCQTLPVLDQLNAGIRFIDIRCVLNGDSLVIYHGVVPEFQNFGDSVLNMCLLFLQMNPTECIIMSVKKEHKSDDPATFYSVFNSYVLQNPDKWYLGDTIPTLGDVRGKIVLFRRFSTQNTMGIDASAWPDDQTFEINNAARLKVQDQYNGIDFRSDMDEKWDNIQALLGEAQSATDNRWYINFTSGTAAVTYPVTVAEGSFLMGTGQNDRLNAYLSDLITGEVGTILMDFPEYPDNLLINQIITLNILGKSNWSGNKPIPTEHGIGSSPSAVVALNGLLYCFRKASGQSGQSGPIVYNTSADGVNWSPDAQVTGASLLGSPSAVVFNDMLYCFFNQAGSLSYNTFDGTNWLGNQPVSTAAEGGIGSSPSAVVFQGQLYCFRKGSGQSSQSGPILYNTLDFGSQWSRDAQVPGAGLLCGPSAVVFNTSLSSKLYCFNQGGQAGSLWYNTFDGTNWSGNQQISTAGGIGSRPSAVEFNNMLYCFHKGSGPSSQSGPILYNISADGANWSPDAQVPGAGLLCGPSAVEFNNMLYCFNQGAQAGSLYYNAYSDDID